MDLTSRILWHLEMALQEPLTLTELADRSGVSKFHMLRVFTTEVGATPMAYLRARRLTEAARMLAAGKGRILMTALDVQYGSHAAFTRAFTAQFGVLPQAIKGPDDLTTLTLTEAYAMTQSNIVPLDPPRTEDRAAFGVVGMGLDCTFDDIAGIPALWQAFNARMGEIDGPRITEVYGVCLNADEAGRFRYVAAVPGAAAPEGMETHTIPAARYAVFTHRGHIGDFPKTVHTVWNKGLPDAGLTPAQTPNFELYDKRFDPVSGRGEVEVWIPVEG